jgi:hypothetical protein
MERTKYFSALALLSLVTLCAVTGLAKPVPRTLFAPSVGANALVQIGKSTSVPIQRPDILWLDNSNAKSAGYRPEGLTLDAPVDFNGDGRTDFVVVRNTGGGPNGQLTWFYAQNGGSSTSAVGWGVNSDWILTEDFDGDAKDDISIWRSGPGGTAGFYILQSSSNTLRVDTFGQTGDVPSIIADYDGDGKADPAVFRNGQPATWFYRSSITGNVAAIQWGATGDIPYPGDFDGDGKTDFGIARDYGNGQLMFWRLLSTGTVMTNIVFGSVSDFLTPGDYDGDGKTDVASINLSSNPLRWQFLSSINGSTSTAFWGVLNDYPTQGDYDGDGKTDLAVWRRGANPGESAFWILRSSDGGFFVSPWGLPTDFPLAASHVF